MANSFFQTGEQRVAKVKELFALVAPRYDLLNDIQSLGLHRYWKRRAARLARPGLGDWALDVCCGTGDLARALVRNGARVVGLDFSPAMLRFAQVKAQKAGLLPPEVHSSTRAPATDAPKYADQNTPLPLQFVCGDAQQLPFPDSSFDIVTAGYGLRNLAQWETGLQEMARVAKPGGRLVVLDFGKPESAVWRSLYFAYLRLMVPCLGRVFCGNARAYAYILESLKHYPAQRGLAEKMRQLGLAQTQTVEFLGGGMSINSALKPAA